MRVTHREISQLQKRVSFRAEWSERSERNAVEESRKLHQGSLVRFLDSATPSTLQQSAGLRFARNDTRFFQTVTLFCEPRSFRFYGAWRVKKPGAMNMPRLRR